MSGGGLEMIASHTKVCDACSILGLADHRHNIFGQEIAAADEPTEEQGGQKEGLETGFLKLVEARFSA